QFVQVAPDQLARLIDDPSGIEDLFATLPPASNVPPDAMERFAGLMEAKRKEFIERGPQMFEATLARMDPRMREEMSKRLERLGINAAGLASGAGGEALLNLMKARAGLASGAMGA